MNSVSQVEVKDCGDTSVKIVHRTGVDLEVHLEVALDRTNIEGAAGSLAACCKLRKVLLDFCSGVEADRATLEALLPKGYDG